MWVWVIELSFPGLAASTFIYWTISLAQVWEFWAGMCHVADLLRSLQLSGWSFNSESLQEAGQYLGHCRLEEGGWPLGSERFRLRSWDTPCVGSFGNRQGLGRGWCMMEKRRSGWLKRLAKGLLWVVVLPIQMIRTQEETLLGAPEVMSPFLEGSRSRWLHTCKWCFFFSF